MSSIDLMLKIYRCPQTHQPLKKLGESKLSDLNEAVRTGELKNEVGAGVQQILDGGLLCEDLHCAYPVRDGVPNLLIEDRIPLSPEIRGLHGH